MRAAAIQLNSNQDKAEILRGQSGCSAARPDGADLVVLPEKFNVLGGPDDLRGRRADPGPTTDWAAALSRELGLWLVAGSIVERVEATTSCATRPCWSVPTAGCTPPIGRFISSTSRWTEWSTASPTWRRPVATVVADAGGLPLGMAVCYDLRFPELFRIMAIRGARAISLPAAFTVPTGRAHWEILVRARAIENQVFVIAAGQIGGHPPDHELRPLDDRRPLGTAGRGAGRGVLRRRRPRPRSPGSGAREASLACEPASGGLPVAAAGGAWSDTVNARRDGAADKRRLILDAAIRVFAREGYHRCRVSDIAREANVAYGLVYHYFRSKDEVLDTLFTERWTLLLDAIAETDRDARLGTRQAAVDRRVHHRLLQQRPRPDEGDHRRGHAPRTPSAAPT